MKYLFYSLVAFLSSSYVTFAADDNYTGISSALLREGKVHLTDIPGMIQSMINFFMGIAGTISVIFIVIGAYKILFWSLEQDKTKGRDTIIAALWGFALAALSWMIIKVILSNLA